MVDDVGFGLLDRAQCLALLRTANLGRVIFTHRAMPAVRPVRFAVHEDSVVFAVPESSILYAGTCDAVVAFEADSFAEDLGDGWYVSLLGRAGEVAGPGGGEPGYLGTCPPGGGRRYLRIPVEAITGRRLTARAE